ncbi:hydrogenase accessory protein [Rhodoplanes elegans]|uniref:Hydrogenase expression/formation protein n=1 Tax=Rhodoplanes elegans TaxID=29408 RepID=A0A327KQB9_9BRAD|nr:hydrogenase accessory protein [Rhodoplanes elegans]MBK5961220.1 hydrogenase accessory protein [Rhodoplanes elegans]RAI37588.1 hydrogenase accessory protein [Rhodoplanes elegans]
MSPLLDALTARHGLPVVDLASVDAALAPVAGAPVHTLLFFTGDPAQHRETADVAVVLPELLIAFQGRLRAALVARTAEDALKRRFHVAVLPSLVMTRGADPLGVLPRICDWSDYTARIAAWLDPATPVMAPSRGPQVEIVTPAGAPA